MALSTANLAHGLGFVVANALMATAWLLDQDCSKLDVRPATFWRRVSVACDVLVRNVSISVACAAAAVLVAVLVCVVHQWFVADCVTL
ncbi:MAG: hypothetical protein IAG10_33140 [Planctomycetaceae bacterium]|nr:hypothetical protein [Planctomycetaceae bacterium]